MFDQIFGNNVTLLEKSLDVRMMRQNLIAANIANSETPGYRAVDIDFETTMQNIADKVNAAEAEAESARQTAEAAGLPTDSIEAEISPIEQSDIIMVTDDSIIVGENGNTVSMENEIAKMQENRVLYSVTAQLLSKQLQGLKEAISGGTQ